METFLIKAIQLILSLSILVIVHEFGHFIFARLYKVRVEKFYLFFNPWFTLFKFKPKNSDTEYGIGWLPLGGYVKIAGMIDESMDKDQLAQPEQPWEFRSKTAGQRLMIMIAGVLFNFILALFIYSMVAFTWGETYIPFKNAKAGLVYSNMAQQAGFINGDIPLSANGKTFTTLTGDMVRQIANSVEVKVLRNGTDTVDIHIPKNFMLRLIDSKELFASFRTPAVIGKVAPDSPAEKAKLAAGDSIVAANDIPIPYNDALANVLGSNKNKTISLSLYRNGELMNIDTPVDSLGRIGIYFEAAGKFYPTVTDKYGFLESFPKGINKGMTTLKGYVGDMKYIFTKEGASSVGGFGAIGSIFPSVWDWETFWNMTAFLSIILAFMNILPIPALDGGHVLFLIYEVVTRRKPNEKFMEYAQIAGMGLLFCLLIFANGNDIFRFFFK